MINKVVRVLSIFLLILFFFSKTANADKSGIIKIPKHDWSSQLVGAEVIGRMMQMVGEKVEYIPINSQKVYQSMADGDIDLVHEIWERAFESSYKKAKNTGKIEEILTHSAVTREEWWYPEYVEKECPGLPDWQALAKCSDIFASEDSNGKGVFIGGPIDWLKYDVEKIEALKINFLVKHVNSVGAIWAELERAVAEKKPILIYNWIPNFIGEKYHGKFIEFPKYDIKCITDPSWGVNPNATYDCGNPANGYLKLAVNINFKKNHPKGYKLIKKINFSGKDINRMAYYVDIGGLEITAAAEKWLIEHESKWKSWLKN